MSIIYEALKKVQGKSGSAAAVPAQPAGKASDANAALKKSSAVRTVILLLVFLALGMFLIEILINRWFAARAKKEKNLPIAASYTPPAHPPLPSIPPAPAQTDSPAPAVSSEPLAGEPQPQLVLNGIVLSEEGNIALINDQILKAGDNIEGALVEEISADQVLLSYKARKIRLK